MAGPHLNILGYICLHLVKDKKKTEEKKCLQMKIGRDHNGDNYHSGAYPKVSKIEINLSKKSYKIWKTWFEIGINAESNISSTDPYIMIKSYLNQGIVFCWYYSWANSKEKCSKCNLIFPKLPKLKKRPASKRFLKPRQRRGFGMFTRWPFFQLR